MSFLNALASDGLSVGLRFYNAKMNSRVNENPAVQSLAVAEEPGCRAKTEEAAKPSKAPKIQESPEEMAAGRAEAKAMLAADGSLGRLAAAQSQEAEEADQAAAPAENAGGGQAAPVAGGGSGVNSLSAEEQQEVERLKAREGQIRAEVTSSVQKGVPGADAVQYTYTKGPDGNRYISGIQGGQSGAPGPAATEAEETSGGVRDLSDEEKQQVEEMKQRDREVRMHEQSHMAAAAGLAGAPVYEYQTGPDGKRYAVGGHVDVRTSGSSDPEVALREAEAVKRAATAPADPSGPDRAAAARASAQINQLRAEKTSQSLSNEDEGKANQAAGNGSDRASGNGSRLAEDAAGIFNGSAFSRQVAGAYAAVKFGSATAAARPVLARA